MNTTFVSNNPPLGHSLALTGAVTVDLGKPGLGRRLHDACKRVASAFQAPPVRSLHPSEISLRHRL